MSFWVVSTNFWTSANSVIGRRLFLLLAARKVVLLIGAFPLEFWPSTTNIRCRHLSPSSQYPKRLLKISQTIHFSRMSTTSTTLFEESGVGWKDIAANTSNHPAGCAPVATPWREAIAVSIAKSRKIRGGNFVQVSTVDPETKEPRCRTVVFRGFLKSDLTNQESCVMKMITDSRSRKVKEIASSPVMEMVWWFSQSSEQYRIRGTVQMVGEEASDEGIAQVRREQWGNLSDSAREQFYWKEPGIPFSEQNEVPTGGRDTNKKVLPPPKEFLLMLLYPSRVDYLRLTDNYRQVDEFDSHSNSWQARRVNP